jgi:hypothetical protein
MQDARIQDPGSKLWERLSSRDPSGRASTYSFSSCIMDPVSCIKLE